MIHLVIGHYTPTDSRPDEAPGEQGILDEYVTVVVAETQQQIDTALLWYPDGIVRKIPVSA